MLKLAHPCTYSFYEIENRVNNSTHNSWSMNLGSVMAIFQNSKSRMCLIPFTLEPSSTQVHDNHLVWTWSIDTWLLNWKFHNLESSFEAQFCFESWYSLIHWACDPFELLKLLECGITQRVQFLKFELFYIKACSILTIRQIKNYFA